MNERRGIVLILILAATVLAARPAQSIEPSFQSSTCACVPVSRSTR